MFLGEFAADFDSHAGVEETSRALHIFPELIDMSRARRPRLRLSPEQREAVENRDEAPETYRRLLLPLPPFDELTDKGALTFLDVGEEANRELGARNFERFVQGLVEVVMSDGGLSEK